MMTGAMSLDITDYITYHSENQPREAINVE